MDIKDNWRRFYVLGPTADCAHLQSAWFVRFVGRMPWHRVSIPVGRSDFRSLV